MTFYEYAQNNSGGNYSDDIRVAKHVIVEAKNARDADWIAESKHGIYFNGMRDGIDCNCCGNRWNPQHTETHSNEGSDVPSIYGKPYQDVVDKLREDYAMLGDEGNLIVIYYLDGTVTVVE